MVILTGDINSYRVNKQGEYQMQVLVIFLTIKTPRSGRHATAYTASVAFSCHLKGNENETSYQ